MQVWAHKQKNGFTIVELLIVIVVIAILAAITVVAYNGIQARAKSTQLQSKLNGVYKKIEAYNAEFGSYPATQSGTLAISSSSNAMVYVDANCPWPTGTTTVTKTTTWVPGVDMTLPQSNGERGRGSSGGCFAYQSDGKSYILTAWNMVDNGPQNSAMYRRIGLREVSNTDQYAYCNQTNIGGNNPTPYDATRDYYKYSYTITNVTSCNETPPAGA